jgi:predicted AlkP superfamily pyrophosphatase or phosphodiesterase
MLAFGSHAQQRPKLVVGIVVDQMRQDYLVRFQSKYGKGGFKRLLSEGFQFSQCNINYVPTYTGPGHAAIYTGTTPQINGIVGNEWLECLSGDTMYCVADKWVETVGSETKAGRMSPRNMYTTTMTDELRLSTNFKGKVIGVCIKDRGSILPAGHSANAAYWFDSKVGNFVTSTYYMNELPEWVKQFNAEKWPEKLINQTWNTYLPIETYTESDKDLSPYEGVLSDKEASPTFPHKLGEIRKEGYGTLLTTPFGNTLTKLMAIKAMEKEGLGKDSITDFLALSFSSTDYIGHNYGINSIELEDAYIRLDRELEELFNYLDAQVGKGKFTVFLSADHGCAHNPQYLKDRKIPAGFFDYSKAIDSLKTQLKMVMNEDALIRYYENQQIYLNEPKAGGAMTRKELGNYISKFMMQFEGVDFCITADQLNNTSWDWGIRSKIQKGFNASRCGDVYICLKPGWMELSRKTGTTHGSAFDYDTHIPFVLMGWGIKAGITNKPVSITDIAPTICDLIKIQTPSGCTGQSVYPVH